MKTSFRSKRLFASLAIVSFLFGANNGFSQTGMVGTQEGDKTTLEQNVYGLGTNFSLMSGIGISFKEHFAHSRLSYMITGYVWKDQSGGTYDYGLEMQYDIYLKQETRFYAFAGTSYFYDGSKVTRDDLITGLSQSIQNQLAGPLRIGAGAGFETAVGSAVCFYASLSVTSFQPSGDLFIYPYGGLMVYFK